MLLDQDGSYQVLLHKLMMEMLTSLLCYWEGEKS